MYDIAWGVEMMNQPKINPAVLRLLVIFPNVLSYILLLGVIVYTMTNYSVLKSEGALSFWLILVAILGPMAIFTSYSILKRIRAGNL